VNENISGDNLSSAFKDERELAKWLEEEPLRSYKKNQA